MVKKMEIQHLLIMNGKYLKNPSSISCLKFNDHWHWSTWLNATNYCHCVVLVIRWNTEVKQLHLEEEQIITSI